MRQTGETRFEVLLVDTMAWLSASANKPEVANALDRGSMENLRKSLNVSSLARQFILTTIPVNSAGTGKDLYLKRNSITNKAEIMAFARNPFTHTPYIPASSIKGAISTALMDFLNEQRRGRKRMLRDTGANTKEIMKEMFGKITEHAMKALRIGDIALPPGVTSIRNATNYNLAPGKTLPMFACEALDPAQINSFGIAGSLRVKNNTGQPVITFPDGRRMAIEELGSICNKFYKERFRKEFDRFYTQPHFQAVRDKVEPLLERLERLVEAREILLRVGRFSHIESVTVSGRPPAMKKGYGKTRTLADGQFPFGWVVLMLCDMDKYIACQNRVAETTAKEIGEQLEYAQNRNAKQREAEARQAREAEEQRAREEALAALSPDEREIWLLEQADANENQAIALYGRLEELGELKYRAATALMEFWQRHGKWKGKELTKKQKEKVDKVRSILEKRRE